MPRTRAVARNPPGALRRVRQAAADRSSRYSISS
jgi:hypothetical protein